MPGKALENSDRQQFDLAMMEYLARLRNGHTSFWDEWLDTKYYQPLGFYALPVAGKLVVQSSSILALKAGDVVSKIDSSELLGNMLGVFMRRQKDALTTSSGK